MVSPSIRKTDWEPFEYKDGTIGVSRVVTYGGPDIEREAITLDALKDIDKVAHGRMERKFECGIPWKFPGEPDFKRRDTELFKDLCDFLRSGFWLRDKNMYTAIASWIVCTHLKPIFSVAPRMIPYASQESGKSRLAYWSWQTAYRAVKGVSWTPANIFRTAHEDDLTIMIDEKQDDSFEIKRTADQILKGGYEKGNVIPRQEKVNGSYITIYFDPFCFASASYKSDLPPSDSQSRGILIPMLPKPSNYAICDPDDEKALERASDLRTRLYTFRQNTILDKELVRTTNEKVDEVLKEHRLKDRTKTNLKVLLFPAVMFDYHVKDIIDVLRKSEDLVSDDLRESDGGRVFAAMIKVYNRQPTIARKLNSKIDARSIAKMTTSDVTLQVNDDTKERAIADGTARIFGSSQYERIDYDGQMHGARVTAIIKNGLSFELDRDSKKTGNKTYFKEDTFYQAYSANLRRFGYSDTDDDEGSQ